MKRYSVEGSESLARAAAERLETRTGCRAEVKKLRGNWGGKTHGVYVPASCDLAAREREAMKRERKRRR